MARPRSCIDEPGGAVGTVHCTSQLCAYQSCSCCSELRQPQPHRAMLSGEALSTGVKLAIPLIAVLLVTQVALAFVSRAAPAMQVFSIGFAVTTAVGAVLLIVLLPDFGYDIVADMSHVGERIEALVLAVKEP